MPEDQDERNDQDERDKELEEAEADAHERTVAAAQRSVPDDEPLVSESVAADPVTANAEPYKSLIEAQDEERPADKDDDEDEE